MTIFSYSCLVKHKACKCPKCQKALTYLWHATLAEEWLLHTVLSSVKQNHTPQVIQLTEAYTHKIMVPEQTENSSLSSTTSKRSWPPTHHLPALLKIQNIIFDENFYILFRKNLKLILKRIFIFNNFPQLSDRLIHLKLNYTRFFLCKIITFKGKMLSYLYFKNLLYIKM